MKKIILLCAGGFSTSLIANKMLEIAKKEEKAYQIKAIAADLIQEEVKIKKPDCILLGPQIWYMLDSLKTTANNIPIAVIPMQDYGAMNCSAIIKLAENLM